MEIFQTIWTALTTENEVLIYIFSIPLTFIEAFINMLLFTTVLNIKATNKQKLLYVCSISLFSILTNLLITNPIRSILNFIVMPIFIHFIFNINAVKSIFSSIFPLILIFILETILAQVCTSLYHFNISESINIPIIRLLVAFIIYIASYILYLIIKYFHVVINILDNMNSKTKIIIFINLSIGILAIFVQFYLVGFYINVLPSLIVILSIVSFLSYFITSIFSLTRITKLQLVEQDLSQEKEHNRILKLAQDDIRGFRHDFANIMCTIGGYVQVKDMVGLTNYYSQIQKDISKVNNLGSLDPAVINHPAIFTLIVSKYDKATELGITMNINCFLDLNSLNMKIYEFTRTLGILLDNSIEAARECEEKIINIEIRKDSSRNRQLLIIENTYAEKEINTEKIYEKNYSTKKGNSGLGLWEVRQILKRNHNLNLFTTKDERFFKQQLEMYNN